MPPTRYSLEINFLVTFKQTCIKWLTCDKIFLNLLSNSLQLQFDFEVWTTPPQTSFQIFLKSSYKAWAQIFKALCLSSWILIQPASAFSRKLHIRIKTSFSKASQVLHVRTEHVAQSSKLYSKQVKLKFLKHLSTYLFRPGLENASRFTKVHSKVLHPSP